MFELLLEGPSDEPITVNQLAIFSQFDAPDEEDDADEFTEVSDQIGAAREQIERLTQYCYLPQTWMLSLDSFPMLYIGREVPQHYNVPAAWPYRPDSIELTRHPVQSLASVKYIDMNGDQQTVDPAIYDVKSDKIVLKPNMSWPVAAHVPESVSVTYTAGYDPLGSPATPVPHRLIRALKFLAGWYYSNRLPVDTQITTPVQMTLDNLLTGFRDKRLAR